MKRLDVLLVERGLAATREQAQRHVLAGEVWTLERRLEKPGVKVDPELPLELRSRQPGFVSRSAEKLVAGLEQFGIDVSDKVCLDIGSSTGGFTDVLLQRGAQFVFAVDVGTAQLHERIRKDSRVAVLEKTNARHLTQQALAASNPLGNTISLGVMDVSFISLRKIVEPLTPELPLLRDWLLLFKPQFELGRKHIRKGGRAATGSVLTQALLEFDAFMMDLGWKADRPAVPSPVPGKRSGNVEYLLHYQKA